MCELKKSFLKKNACKVLKTERKKSGLRDTLSAHKIGRPLNFARNIFWRYFTDDL